LTNGKRPVDGAGNLHAGLRCTGDTRQPATKESLEMRFGNQACGESYFKQDPEFCLAEGQARIAMVECDQAYRVDH
jgi:hypothetical protein